MSGRLGELIAIVALRNEKGSYSLVGCAGNDSKDCSTAK